MKILFTIYQLDYADHISISYLSAIAKNRGHETYFCVLPDLEETIKKVTPDIVAYSLNIYGFEEVIKVHKSLKEKYKFLSIGGGPQATFNPVEFERTGFDVYCLGEGELAFDEFLSKLEAGLPYDDVLNLITPNARNPVRPWIKDLDTIPFPDRDLVLSNSFLGDIPKKTFYATRGCPYSCYYCANNFYNELYRGKGKLIRRFSVDRIIEEIKYIKSKYRMEFLKFGDDLFALKPDDWLKEFSRRYKEEINVPFNCYLRFDTVNPEVLKLLKDANCYSVHLSVDSTSEVVREQILGRKMKPVDIVAQLKMIHDYGIHTWVNFMLAAPLSTVEDDLNTIEVGYKGKITYSAYSTTVPMQGTRLYEYSIEHGLINEDYVGDLNDCLQKSPFLHFSEKEKNIRYNIWLLGPIAGRLPSPFRQMVIFIIKHTKPNGLYLKLRNLYYKYSIENRIFKLH